MSCRRRIVDEDTNTTPGQPTSRICLSLPLMGTRESSPVSQGQKGVWSLLALRKVGYGGKTSVLGILNKVQSQEHGERTAISAAHESHSQWSPPSQPQPDLRQGKVGTVDRGGISQLGFSFACVKTREAVVAAKLIGINFDFCAFSNCTTQTR